VPICVSAQKTARNPEIIHMQIVEHQRPADSLLGD